MAKLQPLLVVAKVDAYLNTVQRGPTKGKITPDLAAKWIEDAKTLGDA